MWWSDVTGLQLKATYMAQIATRWWLFSTRHGSLSVVLPAAAVAGTCATLSWKDTVGATMCKYDAEHRNARDRDADATPAVDCRTLYWLCRHKVLLLLATHSPEGTAARAVLALLTCCINLEPMLASADTDQPSGRRLASGSEQQQSSGAVDSRVVSGNVAGI
jgi:hypothetical protein